MSLSRKHKQGFKKEYAIEWPILTRSMKSLSMHTARFVGQIFQSLTVVGMIAPGMLTDLDIERMQKQ